MNIDELYQTIILDHYREKHHAGLRDGYDAEVHHVNPSCGDELTFSIRLADDGIIEEAAFTGHGCAISQASADIMSDLMVGKTPEEAISLCKLFKGMITGEETDEEKLGELEDATILKDISHMPARVKCAELAWRTLEEMLEERTKDQD